MVAPLYTTASGLLFHAGKILVVTVGLPARGKTHITRALERYLRWMGVKTRVVSLGDYRRKTLGGAQKLPPDYFTLGQKSPETLALRKKVQEGCEQLIWDFFENGGQVVIYDANNGTRAARQALAEKFEAKDIHVVFLESICDKKEIIESNIRSVKISSPDYRGWDPEKAMEDYYLRIRDHEQYYETIEETTWPFIRIFNVGEKITLNSIQGYLQSRIVFFLMNIHNRFRTIYFARSGQSLIEHSYKADSDLSPAGWDYAERLKEFVLDRRAKSLEARGLNPQERRLVIWTSTRRRAHHTAWPFIQLSKETADESALSTSPTTPVSEIPFPVPVPQPTTLAVPLQAAFSSTSSAHPSRSHTPHSHTHSRAHSPPIPHHAHPASAIPISTSSAYASPASHSPAFTPIATPSPLPETPIPKLKPTQPLNIKVVEKPQMLEINPGIWDGLTPDQAKKYYPEDWERFVNDPYAYRAPRAESYHDLSVRLEPTLIELEREQEDLLIIGHASVIRCLLAYLIGLPASEIPAIEIARGDLLEVVPASYGVHSQAFHFWDGPGRKGEGEVGGSGRDENNFYENYAEDTKGKKVLTVVPGADDAVVGPEEPLIWHEERRGTLPVVESALQG